MRSSAFWDLVEEFDGEPTSIVSTTYRVNHVRYDELLPEAARIAGNDDDATRLVITRMKLEGTAAGVDWEPDEFERLWLLDNNYCQDATRPGRWVKA